MRYEDFNMPTWMSMLIGTGVIEVQFLGISERYIFLAYLSVTLFGKLPV